MGSNGISREKALSQKKERKHSETLCEPQDPGTAPKCQGPLLWTDIADAGPGDQARHWVMPAKLDIPLARAPEPESPKTMELPRQTRN